LAAHDCLCGLRLAAAAQGNIGRFNQGKNFVADFELHFFDRARGYDRCDLADACLDNDFAENLIGNDTFDRARELVANALVHNDSSNKLYE